MAAFSGASDYVSGEHISLSALYIFPVGYAAWFLGWGPGLLVAGLATLIWIVGEQTTRPAGAHSTISFSNFAVRWLVLSAASAIVANARRMVCQLMREASRRAQTLRTEGRIRRRLERALMEGEMGESGRLAQDIHDILGQYVSALSLHVHVLASELAQSDSPHVAQAQRVIDLVRRTNRAIRQIDKSTRVPEVEKGGWTEAMRKVAHESQDLSGVPCVLALSGRVPELEEFQSLMLLYITQEACSNAVKHAHPNRIDIGVMASDAGVHLVIRDDGIGFAGPKSSEAGSGLRTMRGRAELIGARLEVRSSPTWGSEVDCFLPLRSRSGRIKLSTVGPV